MDPILYEPFAFVGGIDGADPEILAVIYSGIPIDAGVFPTRIGEESTRASNPLCTEFESERPPNSGNAY